MRSTFYHLVVTIFLSLFERVPSLLFQHVSNKADIPVIVDVTKTCTYLEKLYFSTFCFWGRFHNMLQKSRLNLNILMYMSVSVSKFEVRKFREKKSQHVIDILCHSMNVLLSKQIILHLNPPKYTTILPIKPLGCVHVIIQLMIFHTPATSFPTTNQTDLIHFRSHPTMQIVSGSVNFDGTDHYLRELTE